MSRKCEQTAISAPARFSRGTYDETRAYAAGIFPMAETAEDNALYWVEPEERGIIPLRGLRISHSLRKQVRRQTFEIRIDSAFSDVIDACAAKTKTRKLDLDQHPHPHAL